METSRSLWPSTRNPAWRDQPLQVAQPDLAAARPDYRRALADYPLAGRWALRFLAALF